MKKHLKALIFVLAACGGGADAVPPGLRVNPTSLPSRATGVGSDLVFNTTEQPSGSGGTGAFRTVCTLASANYDDPIVNQTPGTPNLSHLHIFWGNVSVDQNTDITVDPQTTSVNATCTGGTVNRSMYWAPAMIDTRTGNMIQPAFITSYYKTSGVLFSAIQPIPTNFRLIAGTSTASTYQNEFGMYFTCSAGPCPGAPNGLTLQQMSPFMKAGSKIGMNVDFPNCLSTTLGVPDVDSANHKSHAARPSAGVCPGTHPYIIPHISYIVEYTVPANDDVRWWRLSSDNYTGPAGYSIHGDFRMGWKPAIHQSWINGCLKLGSDCHSHLIGCRDENNIGTTCRCLGTGCAI